MAKRNYKVLTSGDIDVIIETTSDNIDAIRFAINEALVRGLEAVGFQAEGYAMMRCPVDTGRLRNSITHQVDEGEKAVYIGTNVEYAPYVELGTHAQKAQPFLRPAAQGHGDEYRVIFESELRKG